MKYPVQLCYDPLSGQDVYRELTPYEYEQKLEWYRSYAIRNQDDKARRIREYCDYLNRWFSDELCDGCRNYEARRSLHMLPMPFNIYFH